MTHWEAARCHHCLTVLFLWFVFLLWYSYDQLQGFIRSQLLMISNSCSKCDWRIHTLCLKKTQLWNGIAQNCQDQFWWYWQKYSNDSRIQFTCFIFHVGLLFLINFSSSFKSDTENNANFDAVSSKCANFDAVDTQPWASECPDVKNYKWQLNPAWHRMLYSCTHMETVGVKLRMRMFCYAEDCWSRVGVLYCRCPV